MKKLLLISALLIAPVAEGQSCLERGDAPIPFVTKERRIPSYVKRWRQLIAHSPYNTRAHYYYRIPKRRMRVPALTTWGNFGWDKSLSTYRDDVDKAYARLFALGGYVENLGNAEELTEDIRQHYEYAREVRCLNRSAKRRRQELWRSFFESVNISKVRGE